MKIETQNGLALHFLQAGDGIEKFHIPSVEEAAIDTRFLSSSVKDWCSYSSAPKQADIKIKNGAWTQETAGLNLGREAQAFAPLSADPRYRAEQSGHSCEKA